MLNHMWKHFACGIAGAIACAGLFVSPPARAADPAKAVALAIEQSRLAESASDLSGVRARLQGIINCMVGPEDSLYSASGGDQCANVGNGAVRDVSADRPNYVALKDALKKAIRGLRTDDPGRAKRYAAEAREYLVRYK